MLKFNYVATDADGTEVKGAVEGESSTAAALALAERGLMPSSMSERKGLLQFELTKKKLPRKDLMQFSRQLAVFLRSGIPVLDALEIIREEVPKKSVFVPCLADMVERLRAGVPFSVTVESHPEAFPPFYLGVVQAAEMTGNLDQALDELSDYIDRDVEARRKITSALFYPAVVFVMSIAVVLILTAFVLPRFKKFFQQLDAKLPLPTRMLLAVTDFITAKWPFLVGGFVVIVLFLVLAPRTAWGRRTRDRVLLKLPIIGELISGSIIERFCRTLSSMVRAGVPLPDALQVTSSGTNNTVFREGLDEVRTSMMRGEGLAGPIARTGLFPGAAKQMIRVGEETGTLDQQLATSAEYYSRELDFKITRFTNLFEPAVIVFMGVVVGFVAVALVSAMYGIFNREPRVIWRAVSRLRARFRAGGDAEAGITLAEVLVAVTIMGLAVGTIVAGLATAASSSSEHRKLVSTDMAVRSYAEAIKESVRKGNYQEHTSVHSPDYSPAAISYTEPAGYHLTVSGTAYQCSSSKDIVLVLDLSSSIAIAGAVDDVQRAADAFLNGLAGTPARVAIVGFGSTAQVYAGPTLIRTGLGQLLDIVNGTDPDHPMVFGSAAPPYEYTNWDDGLVKAGNEVALMPGAQVVVVTDGVPNRWIDDTTGATMGTSTSSTIDPTALQEAKNRADILKGSHSRIFALGVGTLSAPDQDALQQISGTRQYTTGGSVPWDQADWGAVTDYPSLQATMADIAAALSVETFSPDCTSADQGAQLLTLTASRMDGTISDSLQIVVRRP